MQTVLRFLGYICYIGAAASIVLSGSGEAGLLLVVPALFILGIVFFSLAEILQRITRVEFLLRSSPLVSTDRVRTDVGEFERLGNVEGEATCAGCRRTVPKANLYYSKAMDVYYHPECLARDVT